MKRNLKLCVILAALMAGTQLTIAQNTVCNPCNLAYRFALETDDENQLSYREAADCTMLVFKGEYYLFASKCGGYFHSTDMLTWDLITTDDLPIEGYAPTAEEMDGKVYFTYSTGTDEIYVTDDPKTGKWEKVEGTDSPGYLADPMLLYDEGHMYIFYGSSGDPNDYIQGRELDTTTFAPVGDIAYLFNCNMEENGWEVPGDYNGSKSEYPWLEGAWVNKYNGKYYLQYSSPSTSQKSYNDAVYVADSPLGPYSLQRHNPFAYRPEGYVAGAGHGSTFQDINGNYWHICTATISVRHIWERRLSLYPVFFDADGEMYAYTGFGDYPMIIARPPRILAGGTVNGLDAALLRQTCGSIIGNG